MFLNNAANYGQAEASSLFAGRHIGFEQAVAVRFRQADTVVDNINNDVSAIACRVDMN